MTSGLLRQIPNIITVARVLLVIPTAWCLIEGRYVQALVSDGGRRRVGRSGRLARAALRLGHVGSGAAVDPLADKILVGVLFITLTVQGALPLWVAGIAIGRDVVILAGAAAYRLMFKHIEFAPTLLSKANTAVQIVVLLLLLPTCADFPMLSPIAGSVTQPYGFWLVAGARDRFGRRLRHHVESPRRARSGDPDGAGRSQEPS